jgi:hypothetical protein
MQKVSKIFLIICCFIQTPKLSFCQTNELYNLLGWNTSNQQQHLIAWYDLQDVSTIKVNPNKPGQVFGLNDKGIGKNHISQDREMYQPLLTRDEGFTNGTKNGLSFNSGGYMVYKFESEKSVNGITSFVVCKNDIGGSKLLYDLGKEGGAGIASCYSGLNKIDSRVPNSSAQFVPDFSNNPNKILLISTKGSSGKINSYLNDANYLGPGSKPNVVDDYRTINNFQGNSYNRIRFSMLMGDAPTNGTLYELILFDYELNEEEFNIVKTYLEKKYKFISTTSKHLPNSPNSVSPLRSSLIEGKSVNLNSKLTDEISYVRLGDIDVLTSDLGELTYDDAKNAIKNLGQGWRLPNERELKLMFENQNTIGLLSKKEFKVINGYWRYTGNYLGAESERRYLILRTFTKPRRILEDSFNSA